MGRYDGEWIMIIMMYICNVLRCDGIQSLYY